MSEANEKPDRHKVSSFLSAAIYDWPAVLRTLAFVVGLAAIVVTMVGFCLWLITPYTENVESFEATDGHYAIRLRSGQQVTVVSVPAMQLAVPTGMFLDAASDFSIRAVGGLVLTVGGLPSMPKKTFAGLPPDVAPHRDMLDSDLDRDANPGWREPDGKLYYGKRPLYGHNEDDPERTKMKLAPNAEWGCLLAFVVPPDTQYPDDVFKYMAGHKAAFLEVGNGDTIRYNSQTKQYFLENRHTENGRAIEYALPEKGQIYLTVNDVLVTNVEQIRQSDTDLKRPGRTPLELHTEEQYFNAQRELVSDSFRNSEPYGIWYLDNRGSFTVAITKKSR